MKYGKTRHIKKNIRGSLSGIYSKIIMKDMFRWFRQYTLCLEQEGKRRESKC